MGQRIHQPDDVFPGLGVETVIKYSVSRVQGRLGLNSWITHADLTVISNAKLAPYLQRNSRERLMWAHTHP